MNKSLLLLAAVLAFGLPAKAGVVDGTPVNAVTTNAAFMDKNTAKTFTIAIADIQGGVETKSAVDSVSTGSLQSVTLVAPITIYTNGTLSSIQNITLTNKQDASYITIRNNTGGSLTLKNLTGGTSSNQINTGTGADLILQSGAAANMYYDTVSSKWQVTAMAGADVNASNIATGTLPPGRLPNPTASTLGGIQSLAAVSHNWINTISTSGVPSATQPAFVDISGTASLTSQVNGILPIVNGGTGQSAQTAAFDALSPLTTAGDSLSYGSGHNIRIAAGALGLPYLSGGTSVPNSWAVLAVAGGGTGYSSLTSGSVLVGAGTTSPTLVAPGTNGNVLTSNGTTWTSAAAGAGSGTPYNFLVNGAFDYWQVGTSISAAAGASAYAADQWFSDATGVAGSGTVIMTQVTGVTNGSLFGASVKMGVAGNGSSVTGAVAAQLLSNKASAPLYGQTASFSILVKALTNVNQVTLQFIYNTSESRASYSVVSGSSTTCAVNTSTFTTCTINGQALGTAQGAGGIVGVKISASGVSTGNKYDINNGFVLEQGMVSLGAIAAAFSRQNQNPVQELAACQFFYRLITGANGTAVSATSAQFQVYFPTMRIAPAVLTPTSVIQVSDMSTANFTQSSAQASINESSTSSCRFTTNNYSGMTTNRPTALTEIGGAVPLDARM